MPVKRDERFTSGAYEKRWTRRAWVALLGIFALFGAGFLGLAMFKQAAGAWDIARGMGYVALGIFAVAAFWSTMTRSADEIRSMRAELESQYRRAQYLDDGHALFFIFPPTQERADEELCKRGRRMGDACRALNAFDARHPEVRASRARGNPSGIEADVLTEEATLQRELDEAKEGFWTLHSQLWRVSDRARGYILEDSWQKYDVPSIKRVNRGVPKGVGTPNASDPAVPPVI